MAVAGLSAARRWWWLWRSESSISHNHHFHSGISSVLLPHPPPHSFMGPKEEQEEGNRIPNFSSFQASHSSGSMQLMAVPKKKVSRSKRGIRNGPKALKPVPVIVRCKCCGRVKLPHFYCCSGDRGTGQQTEDAK